LKTESIEASDQEDLGVLMVVLLVSIFVSAISIVVFEVRAVAQWVRPIWHAFSILQYSLRRQHLGEGRSSLHCFVPWKV
jgi:hypothetical protein